MFSKYWLKQKNTPDLSDFRTLFPIAQWNRLNLLILLFLLINLIYVCSCSKNDFSNKGGRQIYILFSSVYLYIIIHMGFPGSSAGKESTCNAGNPGSIPGLGRSPGEGIRLPTPIFLGFPHGSDGKESTCNVGDLGSVSEMERSPRRGHGNPLQYSCLKNPHGQRSLVGYSPWDCRVWHNWVTKHTQNTYRAILYIYCIWPCWTTQL